MGAAPSLAAGGNAEYHLFSPHGGDGHFFVGAADAVPASPATGPRRRCCAKWKPART
jgi:hypothetical protein